MFFVFVVETIIISVMVSIAFSAGYLHRTVKYLKSMVLACYVSQNQNYLRYC